MSSQTAHVARGPRPTRRRHDRSTGIVHPRPQHAPRRWRWSPPQRRPRTFNIIDLENLAGGQVHPETVRQVWSEFCEVTLRVRPAGPCEGQTPAGRPRSNAAARLGPQGRRVPAVLRLVAPRPQTRCASSHRPHRSRRRRQVCRRRIRGPRGRIPRGHRVRRWVWRSLATLFTNASP